MAPIILPVPTMSAVTKNSRPLENINIGPLSKNKWQGYILIIYELCLIPLRFNIWVVLISFIGTSYPNSLLCLVLLMNLLGFFLYAQICNLHLPFHVYPLVFTAF